MPFEGEGGLAIGRPLPAGQAAVGESHPPSFSSRDEKRRGVGDNKHCGQGTVTYAIVFLSKSGQMILKQM